MRRIGKMLRALHSDEQGADMVEYVLIIAAIALPLLAVVIWFWQDIRDWVGTVYSSIRGGGGGTAPPTYTGPN